MHYAFYEPFHLGDHMWFVMFAHKVMEKHPDITFDFYSDPDYHAQLLPLTDPTRFSLKPKNDRPPSAIVAWAGDENFWFKQPTPHRYERLYFDWFAVLSKRINIEHPFANFTELVWNMPPVALPPALDQDYDVLIVNSQPLSGEWFTFDTFNPLGQKLAAQGFKIIATHPNTFGAVSTLDSGLNIAQLSALSQRCKNIVGISNAPFLCTANAANLKSPNTRWFGVSNDGSLGYDTRFNLVSNIPQLNALTL